MRGSKLTSANPYLPVQAFDAVYGSALDRRYARLG